MSLPSLLAKQSSWARTRWAGHSGKRAPSLEENLFQPLCDATHDNFAKASGNELGLRGRPPKMDSLRSSSALVCNVFDPWRGSDLEPLTLALRLEASAVELRFEQQFRHGLRGIPPNLDVALYDADGQVTGVECKFTEPYGPKKPHAPIDAKYFRRGRRRWSEVDLPTCQQLAEAVGDTLSFRRLSVGQLLKHILGLRVTGGAPVRLRYVWYNVGNSEAREHAEEIAQFRERIDTSIDFDVVTYQQLFTQLRTCPEPTRGYHEYLRERYFSS